MIYLALLKFSVDILAQLIEVEGGRLLRDQRTGGDPADAESAREAPRPPRGKQPPVTKINIYI